MAGYSTEWTKSACIKRKYERDLVAFTFCRYYFTLTVNMCAVVTVLSTKNRWQDYK